jgi:diacylglycerol O-acyltransferase / wax synthase
MQQLSAIDASFLYAETSRTPMHVTALQIYEPASTQFSFARVVENVRQRAGHMACYHRKLVTVPWGLDHPYWVNDANFEPLQHMFEYTLAEPGGWSELCMAVATLHAQPLDRSKPLWEMHIIPRLGHLQGIAENAYAVVTKIHHAAVDGVAGISVTAALHDLEPTPSTTATPVLHKEALPSPLALLCRSAIKDLTRPLRTLNAFPTLTRMTALPVPPYTPRTRFNQRVSGKHVFDALHFPIERLRTIKNLAGGATINDVVLTIVGGGLRKYLLSHKELPARSLTTMVPVSTRKTLNQPEEGNRISQLIVPLGTHIAGAPERLQAIRTSTAAAKQKEQHLDNKTTGVVAELAELAPAPWLSFTAQGWQPKVTPAVANTVITNVKAPPIPLYSCGARLVSAYGSGPIVDGAALFHTAMSYCDELNLSVMSCAKALPDLPFYLSCLQHTYEELADAAAT